MSKKILFIWNYFYFPWEKGKSRFSDLAEAIVRAGYDLEVVCSSFYHMGKSMRDINNAQIDQLPYKVRFIDEPGYVRNVSVRRILSIRQFNKGVRNYLKGHDSVDLVYVPVPPCKTALIAKRWCSKTGAKLVIDIEDLWPESFQMIIRPRWLCKLLTLPLKQQANRCYQKADAIVGVSRIYVDRALGVRKDKPQSVVAPIGSDFEYVQSLRANYKPHLKPSGKFWITYIGTLGSSYDIQMAMDACEAVFLGGHDNIVLNILGSGPDERILKEHVKTLHVPVVFYGLLPYEGMMEALFESDLGLNPIVKGSVASLINKIGDYAAAGLPVLNSQDCKEYCDLLHKYEAGVSVPASDETEFRNALKRLIEKGEELAKMRQGSLKLGKTVLSRQTSQRAIIGMMDSLTKGK